MRVYSFAYRIPNRHQSCFLITRAVALWQLIHKNPIRESSKRMIKGVGRDHHEILENSPEIFRNYRIKIIKWITSNSLDIIPLMRAYTYMCRRSVNSMRYNKIPRWYTMQSTCIKYALWIPTKLANPGRYNQEYGGSEERWKSAAWKIVDAELRVRRARKRIRPRSRGSRPAIRRKGVSNVEKPEKSGKREGGSVTVVAAAGDRRGRLGVSFYANANEIPACSRRFFKGHPAHALHRPYTHTYAYIHVQYAHEHIRARAILRSMQVDRGALSGKPASFFRNVDRISGSDRRAGYLHSYREELYSVFPRKQGIDDGETDTANAEGARRARGKPRWERVIKWIRKYIYSRTASCALRRSLRCNVAASHSSFVHPEKGFRFQCYGGFVLVLTRSKPHVQLFRLIARASSIGRHVNGAVIVTVDRSVFFVYFFPSTNSAFPSRSSRFSRLSRVYTANARQWTSDHVVH